VTADLGRYLSWAGTAERGLPVLKAGDTFAVLDHAGDVTPGERGGHGLYHQGTRFLSGEQLCWLDHRPVLLASALSSDGLAFRADFTNPGPGAAHAAPARETLHLRREKFLSPGACHELLRFANHGSCRVSLPIALKLAADFADLFEVRGVRRAARGRLRPAAAEGDFLVVLAYEGLDGVLRSTWVAASIAPHAVVGSALLFSIDLDPGAHVALELALSCHTGPGRPVRVPAFRPRLDGARAALEHRRTATCRLRSSHGRFEAWLERARGDLDLLTTETPHGPYPYAGVPWYATPFGRDGLITALECLWLDPDLAGGVLRFLAATQAREADPSRDAQPGKILHEARDGEMARLGEVPFGRYYGTVDATPLFVTLAAAHLERTADVELARDLWPAVEAALAWMQGPGDADGDGFIEYRRESESGLVQQGWKDSHDSVFHADGSSATGPIALCEVQGYAYSAWTGAAGIADVLGHRRVAANCRRRAGSLRERFEHAFWCEDLGTYALALDGAKRPCRVRTSNAGHVLFSRLAGVARARRVAETLLSPASSSGWGIRTVAATEARYNPLSYHNGSIWPHDNALVARGLAAYGVSGGARALVATLFEASLWMPLHRLPELYCGFAREPGSGPTEYPVACSPQAWSSAAAFLLIESCLGLTVTGRPASVSLVRPSLPPGVDDLSISGLRVGGAAVDLALARGRRGVRVTVPRIEGGGAPAILVDGRRIG
jgi:glycogen debranching enzyme